MYKRRVGVTRRTKSLFLMTALALIVLASGLSGSPLTCATGTVSDYQAAGFQCSLGSYTLEQFTFSDSSTGGASLVAPSNISVVPSYNAASGIALEFHGDFNASAGQTAQYIIQFELDPLLPNLTGTSISTGPNDPVTLTGQFCGDGTLAAYVAGQPTSCSGTASSGIFPLTLMITGNNQATSQSFPVLVTDIDTRLILDLVGPASVSVFGTGTSFASPDVSQAPAPEPSTPLLLASGLFAFVWWRKKLAARISK
jgi:hypothetical protein